MGDDLRARLESHSRAFESLMDLMPADLWYSDRKDNSDQWLRKKQTKEQKRQAKRAKLDPGAYKSALDVHRENERKRKREDEDDVESDRAGNNESGQSDKPKKQKTNGGTAAARGKPKDQSSTEVNDEARRVAKAEKRKQKRERKKEKQLKQKEKNEGKKVKKSQEKKAPAGKTESRPKQVPAADGGDSESESDNDKDEDSAESAVIKKMDLDGLDAGTNDLSDTSASTPVKGSPTFDTTFINHSSASSSSSIQPPESNVNEQSTVKANSIHPDIQEDEDQDVEPNPDTQRRTRDKNNHQSKIPPIPTINQEALNERLQARIAELRAARKADGIDGKPARSRQDLIEARRRKEEQRKQHKKELRAKAKADQQLSLKTNAPNNAEAEAARLRGGSDSPLWDTLSPRADTENNNFLFNRLDFADGTQYSSTTKTIRDPWSRHKKGPSDPATALAAAKAKESRLAGLDATKQADISTKDAWLNAQRRAHGEKVKDDSNLLKKALKRKEKQKGKSGKEWEDRLEGVKKGQEARQRKREDNLAKRREEKGRGKKGRIGSKVGGAAKGGAAKKKRPGFEGTFKSGARRAQ